MTKAGSDRKPTPHQRIIQAAKAHRGIRLSAEECFYLSMDDAIETRARCDDENDNGIPDEEIRHGFE